jgi:hypothetical protein
VGGAAENGLFLSREPVMVISPDERSR